jgi:hypothetical protein
MGERRTVSVSGGWIPIAQAVGRATFAGLASVLVAAGPGLAHAGHDSHDAGGSGAISTVILLGSVVVIGVGAYLDHTDAVDDRLARAGVLLGVLGVVVGLLAAI